jgi:hypothetical protein
MVLLVVEAVEILFLTRCKLSRSDITRIISFSLVLFLALASCFIARVKADGDFRIGSAGSFLDEESKKVVAMRFVEEIVGIDVDAYDSVSYSVSTQKYPVGSVPYAYTNILIRLCRGNLRTDVVFGFVEHKFDHFNLYSNYFYGPYNAPPHPPLLKPRTTNSTIDVARSILNKYRALVNATYIDRYIPLLDRLTAQNSSEKVSDNDVTLNFRMPTPELPQASIRFEYTVDGLRSPWLHLGMSISEDGLVTALGDSSSLYRIGSTTVTIIGEDAVQIALNNATQYIGSIGAQITKTETELCLDRGKDGDGLTLYPYWGVTFTFDKLYPNNTDAYYVGIWADTGEIAFSVPQGYYGPLPGNEPLPTWLAIPPFLIAATLAFIAYRKTKRQRSV